MSVFDERVRFPGGAGMNIKEILEHLGLEYARKGYSSAWNHERPRLQGTLESFAAEFGNLYHLTKPLSLGGSGIALAAEFTPLENEAQVLKFPRPVLNQEETLNRLLATETEKLRNLRHQNIIRITFQGEIEGPGAAPFYAMEYLEGVRDADDYLAKLPDAAQLTSSLIEIVRGSLHGVAYLHNHGIVHLDLKPANLFVDVKGNVVVADFGFAKKFAVSGQTATIGGTDGYMHPDYAQLMVKTSDRNRNQGGPIRRDELKPSWDLFSLGRTYLKLLEIVDERDPKGSSDYERQYVRLMACRMLDGRFSGEKLPYGLPAAIFQTTSYHDVQDAITDLGKLTGSHNLAIRVPEMSRYQKHTIQASTHGPVPFTERVEKLIDSPEVRHLGQLPQLGLVHFIYPTATHSRLEHSLGTFAMVCRYVRALYNDPFNPLFRQLVTDQDIEAVLIAALVHDIGHYPLAHDLEEAEEEVFGHERRTLDLLRTDTRVADAINANDSTAVDDHWTVNVQDVTDVLDRTKSGVKNQILRSCLDGPIDADKLDYLLRDSENLRLPYGHGIDVEKLIQSLTVVAEIKLGVPTAQVGIHERGKIAAESLAFARYAMYGSVYWHHTHRSAKAMLNALAFEALHQADMADRTSKSGYLKTLREALYKFISGPLHGQTQLALTTNDENDSRSIFLDAGSERLIRWLDERGGKIAHTLAEALLKRDLFKRALVVSQVHDGTFDWRVIEDVYGHVGKNWRVRRRVNGILQDFTLDRLESAAGSSAGSALSPSIITEAVAAANAGPVILVDYPPDKSGVLGGTSLDYLREGAFRHDDGVGSGVADLEQSPVWRSLRNDSRESLAKLRVFCHPKLQAPISAAIPRTEFEKAIKDAIAQAQHEVR